MTEHDCVMGIDPGGTTGVATFRLPIELGAEPLVTLELEPQDYADRVLKRHVTCPEGRWLIVCESYTVTPSTVKMSRQYDPLELIGLTRYALGGIGDTFVLQDPAPAKQFATNDWLKARGWYFPGQPHATDAIRHALFGALRYGYLSDEVLDS